MSHQHTAWSPSTPWTADCRLWNGMGTCTWIPCFHSSFAQPQRFLTPWPTAWSGSSVTGGSAAFFIITPPHSSECAQALATITQTCTILGVPLAEYKCDGPSTCLTFLGIEVDTVVCQLHLPQDKLHCRQSLLECWKDKKVREWRELKSLVGVLHHACKACHIMHMIRTLAFVEASNDFYLSPQYISTGDNHLADDLSRDNLSSFLSKVPHADRQATPLPSHLVELLLDPATDWTSQRWLRLFSGTSRTVLPHRHAEPTSLQ